VHARLVLSLLLAASVSCGGDGPPTVPDGSVDGAGPDADSAVVDIQPPAAPAPVVLTPCPPDWREVGDSPVRCDPWPATGRDTTCADDEAHFPGEPGCRTVGAACPTDGWPTDLPASGVVYVRQGGSEMGTGERDRPYASLAYALSVIAPGTILALAPGRYGSTWFSIDELTVRGTCAAQTVFHGSGLAYGVGVTARGVRIQDISVESTGEVGLTIRAATDVELSGIVIDDTGPVGLRIEEASTVVAEDIVVRDVTTAVGSGLGRAFDIGEGSVVQVTRGVFERSVGAGILVYGATAELSDVVVSDIDPREMPGGVGIMGDVDATITVRRSVVLGATGTGIYARNRDTVVRVEDSLIADSRVDGDSQAHGVSAGIFGHLELIRVRIANAVSTAAGVNAEATMRFEDLLIEGTRPREDEVVALGLAVSGVSRIEGVRFHSFDDSGPALATLGGGTMEVSDATVIRTEASGDFGRGVEVDSGGMLTLTRAAIDGAHNFGLGVLGTAATATVADLVVNGTRAAQTDDDGYGIAVEAGASLTLSRAEVSGSTTGGVVVAAADARLNDIVVRDVSTPACEGCLLVGSGIASVRGANVQLEGFLVERADICGLQVAQGAGLDATRGAVQHNAIGACVQTVEFSLERIQDRVAYSDNETNLDTTELPVPDLLGADVTGL